MNFSLRPLITRLLGPRPDLAVSTRLWHDLLEGLRDRGRGTRESGAFLLGPPGHDRVVTDIVFYDAVDPAAFDTGIIVIDGGRMSELWRICRERALMVVADVHTHPGGAWQSDSDRKHPMVAEVGHVALIIPDFASEPVNVKDVGLYRYAGAFRWHQPRGRFLRPTLQIGG